MWSKTRTSWLGDSSSLVRMIGEKCVDAAKGTILSRSAGDVEKKAIDVKKAPPYRRMIVPIMNGHAAAITSYAH